MKITCFQCGKVVAATSKRVKRLMETMQLTKDQLLGTYLCRNCRNKGMPGASLVVKKGSETVLNGFVPVENTLKNE